MLLASEIRFSNLFVSSKEKDTPAIASSWWPRLWNERKHASRDIASEIVGKLFAPGWRRRTCLTNSTAILFEFMSLPHQPLFARIIPHSFFCESQKRPITLKFICPDSTRKACFLLAMGLPPLLCYWISNEQFRWAPVHSVGQKWCALKLRLKFFSVVEE